MLEKQFISLTFMESVQLFGPKIFVALLCGGLIGLERELKSKSAGIKTNMLICVGAMLYTAISVVIANSNDQIGVVGDPTRIAAQIVSGIGFIGGGAILKSGANVVGMTTAATIWLVAAIGCWIGAGQLELALSVTLLILLVLVSVTFFENRFLGKRQLFKIVIHLREKTDEVTRAALEALLTSNELSLEDYRENLANSAPEVRVSYLGRTSDHSKLLLELWKIPGILDVKQS
ncbi:MAG: MgtC/SapB family protein [Bdellovibrionales bacterium]|nr:MgtC/SapB family protein [Bdellovibrionales bacterium]